MGGHPVAYTAAGASHVGKLTRAQPTRSWSAKSTLRRACARAAGAPGHRTQRVDGPHRAIELAMLPKSTEALHHWHLPVHWRSGHRAVSTWHASLTSAG